MAAPCGPHHDGFRAFCFSLSRAFSETTISQSAGERKMTEFHAQPYSLDHTGFYFNSIESFEAGMKHLNSKGCEEVEIQVIDGESHLVSLAAEASIHQGNVHDWYEELEDLDEAAATQIMFLLDLGYDIADALGRYEDVCLFEGKASDYTYDLINETTEIPESLRYYIDYDAIARDMKINGEITEIERELIVTNAQEF
jgi:antirestriction protein